MQHKSQSRKNRRAFLIAFVLVTMLSLTYALPASAAPGSLSQSMASLVDVLHDLVAGWSSPERPSDKTPVDDGGLDIEPNG